MKNAALYISLFVLPFLQSCGNEPSRMHTSIQNQCHAFATDYKYSLNWFEKAKNDPQQLKAFLEQDDLHSKYASRMLSFCCTCKGKANEKRSNRLLHEYNVLAHDMRVIFANDSLSAQDISDLKKIVTGMNAIVKEMDEMQVAE